MILYMPWTTGRGKVSRRTFPDDIISPWKLQRLLCWKWGLRRGIDQRGAVSACSPHSQCWKVLVHTFFPVPRYTYISPFCGFTEQNKRQNAIEGQRAILQAFFSSNDYVVSPVTRTAAASVNAGEFFKQKDKNKIILSNAQWIRLLHFYRKRKLFHPGIWLMLRVLFFRFVPHKKTKIVKARTVQSKIRIDK